MPMSTFSPITHWLLEAALAEDIGTGDITVALLPAPDAPTVAHVVPRQAGVICGLAVAPLLCEIYTRRYGQRVIFTPADDAHGRVADGAAVAARQTVATVAGPLAAVLTLERTLLNLLGRLSGVATFTHELVAVAHAANPHVALYDTRKTLPGWRELDKYAVRMGGGHNHRSGLYDAVLLKDNHLAGVPVAELGAHVAKLLERLQAASSAPGRQPAFVEVEVDNLVQLEALLGTAGVDVILLDNFSLDDLRAAVALRDGRGLGGRVGLEASGGVTRATLAAVAATGVDRIAMGALTHAAPSLDLGLDR